MWKTIDPSDIASNNLCDVVFSSAENVMLSILLQHVSRLTFLILLCISQDTIFLDCQHIVIFAQFNFVVMNNDISLIIHENVWYHEPPNCGFFT